MPLGARFRGKDLANYVQEESRASRRLRFSLGLVPCVDHEAGFPSRGRRGESKVEECMLLELKVLWGDVLALRADDCG